MKSSQIRWYLSYDPAVVLDRCERGREKLGGGGDLTQYHKRALPGYFLICDGRKEMGTISVCVAG